MALLVGSPRLDGRQEQLERQFLARQRAGQVVGLDPTVGAATDPADSGDEVPEHEAIISLAPLKIAMVVILCLAWTIFLYQRRFGTVRPSAGQDEHAERSVS